MKLFKDPPIKVRVEVPIYNVDLWIIVDEDAAARRSEMTDLFGEPPEHDWCGLCSYGEKCGTVALFFYADKMGRDIIAHEVFHATVRILGRAGVRFDLNNHEAYAYLCGWITGEVYAARE